MTIYSVTSTDDLEREPMDRCLVGSYTSRGRAIDECVEYVMDRLNLRFDLAYSLAHDENHPEAAKFFSERRKDGATVVRRGCVNKLREHLRDIIGGEGGYVAYDGSNSWHFDVDENDLVGDVWTTVTWGDSDCEDVAFNTPTPEVFSSEETAVKSFVDRVRNLCKSNGERFTSDMEKYIRAQLRAFNQVKVDLDDGCAVNCVLWHDDMKTVKE